MSAPATTSLPSARDPGMLFVIGASGAKRCVLCGEVYTRSSQAYPSHAAKHIREGRAEPVATLQYRRWYRLTTTTP